jgi:hypothetical protein
MNSERTQLKFCNNSSVADLNPGTGVFLTPGSGIRCLIDPLDPGSGMGKKSGSGSGMNSTGHISECLETIFLGFKIHKFFYTDLESGMEKIRIQD